VPADNGLGPDQDEVASPIAAEAAYDDPRQLVAGADLRALAGRAGQDGQLVAQQQVLGEEVGAAAQAGSQGSEDESEQLEHGPQDR
jgi:hypothetical protein